MPMLEMQVQETQLSWMLWGPGTATLLRKTWLKFKQHFP